MNTNFKIILTVCPSDETGVKLPYRKKSEKNRFKAVKKNKYDLWYRSRRDLSRFN